MQMNQQLRGLGRITSMLVMGSAVLVAQGTQTANIIGQTVTKSGEPISGVTVYLASPSLQGTRHLVTDSKGRFLARLLPSGTYTITLVKEGLQTVKVNATVGMGQSFEPRYTMASVGSAQVEVIATASDLDKTDIKTATNYRLDTVDELPNGRTVEAVALLTPGVTSGVGGRVQIRGAMTSGNLYLLDGQNITDNSYGNRGLRLIDDSIEEVQIITGAISAEYGDVDGGVVNAITRSGSNEFTGQLRWEERNAAWNAYQPMQKREATNKLNEEKTLSISGPIIKDKLWFSGSFFSTDQNDNSTIGASIPVYNYSMDPDTLVWGLAGTTSQGNVFPSEVAYTTGDGPSGLGAIYDTRRKEFRRQIKLTYTINEAHRVVGSFSNAEINDVNRNYSAGATEALVPQVSTSQFMNLQWLSVWSNRITSELKWGYKKQKLSAGADAANGSPIYNYGNGYFYQNGIFNSFDGGDNRDNFTINGKVTLWLDVLGSHQMDIGFDYYKGTHRAKNDQSATGYIFGVRRMNLTTQRAFGRDIWEYESFAGDANTFTNAIFVNDKWIFDKHLVFNIGFRLDNFKAENEGGAKTAGASGFSPRLGAKYDVLADGKYVAGISFARYNAKVLEGITNSVTSQGNPTEIDHPYVGPDGPQSFAFLSDLSTIQQNYDFSTILYYNNPSVNVRLADNLKAPQVDEAQVDFQYSFNNPMIGNGFVSLTAVHKEWKNLFDYRVGNDGTVTTPDGSDVYLKIWENSDVATRKYQSIELQSQIAKGKYQFSGGITWSKLWGNYEGEGSSTPARGEGLKNFTVQDGVVMYEINTTSPMGYLQGHVPLRVRLTGSYVQDNAWGKTTWGLVYRFDSGSHYSATRVIDPSALNENISLQYGSSATQYYGGRGMQGVFGSASYLDLAITHDFVLFKAGKKNVNAFFKANISNVLNHQQQLTWDVTYADGGSLDEVFVPAGNREKFGLPLSSNDYGIARIIAISTGLRF
jgi:hypothetical protein